MSKSNIEWTDYTFNPWIGCTKVDPICENCYAERDDKFRHWTESGWGAGMPRKRTSENNWRLPEFWNAETRAGHFQECSLCGHRASYSRDLKIPCKNLQCDGNRGDRFPVRGRVFCASLSDVFDTEVSDQWRDDLFDLIYKCRDLDWLILTKRPRKASQYLLGESGAGAANLEQGGIFEHVAIGTSVGTQRGADSRIREIVQVPARVRFLSCEPLIEPVDLHLDRFEGMIDWVICGGESGTNARPMHPEWARSLCNQSRDAGAAFLFKQWGEWAPEASVLMDGSPIHSTFVNNSIQHICERGERLYRVGKKRAGRLLDGHLYNEFPRQFSTPRFA